MKIITAEEIKSLNISHKECLDWVVDMLKCKSNAILPPKISMKTDGHIFYNTMPCILKDFDIAGIKCVNRYPNSNPCIRADLLLYDLTTGDLKALIDATDITRMRTGAVAAHSMILFAKSDYKTIGLIGLGSVTSATMDIFLDHTKGKSLIVKLYKYKDHAEKFIKRYENYTNVQFIICDTYEETITDSDIIVSGVTYAEKDFCDNKCYKEGCLVVPIHTLGFQNCDLFFDKVYGDDYSHICGFKYFKEFANFNEVSAVVNGTVNGREDDKERILVYNIGIAVHDIYYSHKIYEKMLQL